MIITYCTCNDTYLNYMYVYMYMYTWNYEVTIDRTSLMKTLLDKYHDTVVAYAFKILYIRCMYFKEKIKARKKYSHGFVNADKNTLK